MRRIGHVLEGQRYPLLAGLQRRDAMPQLIAIEKHHAPGRQLHRAGFRPRPCLASVQFIIETTRRAIDDPEQQRVAAPDVIRGVVVPADVIAGTRIEVERIRMRILAGRSLQGLPRQPREPIDQPRGVVQLGDGGSQPVDRMTADAAALFVTGKIIAVGCGLRALNALQELREDLVRQELWNEDEGSLIAIFALQRRQIETPPGGAVGPRHGGRFCGVHGIDDGHRLTATLWRCLGLLPLHHAPVFEHHPYGVERCTHCRRNKERSRAVPQRREGQ